MGEKLTLKQVESELWLNYFNSYLFDKGVITERERNKMTALITQEVRKPARKQKDDSWDLER